MVERASRLVATDDSIGFLTQRVDPTASGVLVLFQQPYDRRHPQPRRVTKSTTVAPASTDRDPAPRPDRSVSVPPRAGAGRRPSWVVRHIQSSGPGSPPSAQVTRRRM